MSAGFSTEWLRLREPFDAAARAAELVALIAPDPAELPLDVVDLGAGTGSNLRYLAPRLGGMQRWLLVDHDAALLAAADAATQEWAEANAAQVAVRGAQLRVWGTGFAAEVRRARVDLATDLKSVIVPQRALVTGAALLDLVSAQWLRTLGQQCHAARADLLFALCYDGTTACTPAEPEDREVLELFNRHQLADKGFGPALGPSAPHYAEQVLAALGYRLQSRKSDWRIARSDAALQRALIDGWLEAAVEIAPERGAALEDWRRRRLAHIAAGRSTLVVGHVDLSGRLG